METVRLFIRDLLACLLLLLAPICSLNTTSLLDQDRDEKKTMNERLQIKSDTGKIKMEINGFFMKLCHPLKNEQTNERKTHTHIRMQHIQKQAKHISERNESNQINQTNAA